MNLEELRQAVREGRALTYRFFWGHRASKDGRLTDSCFSQWWPCAFEVDGVSYSSAEQYMMASKARLFGDAAIEAQILATSDPGRCKALGRKVSGFDEGVWSREASGIVVEGNLAKFGQNDRLKHYLLGTRDEVLVEASPLDSIWGIGLARDDERAKDPLQWRGTNLLGFALMEVRRRCGGDIG